mmetsp:Transcript_52719/g.142100  ORF Transcript_52719/g.142100 Transcript_52719/m.142100 type:complete len:156 (+) Transcript_52719:1-468(+)
MAWLKWSVQDCVRRRPSPFQGRPLGALPRGGRRGTVLHGLDTLRQSCRPPTMRSAPRRWGRAQSRGSHRSLNKDTRRTASARKHLCNRTDLSNAVADSKAFIEKEVRRILVENLHTCMDRINKMPLLAVLVDANEFLASPPLRRMWREIASRNWL